jgi:flagellar biosynthesis protein FlhF
MKLKSYFSASVETAMQLARKELGEDALLVNARPATPETRYLGAYEVVFGLVPGEPPVPAATSLASPPLHGEIEELRRQVDRLTMSMSLPRPTDAARLPAPEPYAGDLSRTVAERLQAGAPLCELVAVDADVSPATALVGPPGVGKTSTLLKLAVRYGLAQRRTVQILSADVFRIAAADQLRSLGIGCDVVETPSALAHAISEHRSKSLLLIDTPGYCFRDMDQASDLAAILKAGGVDTHLLVPASMKMDDLSRTWAAYKLFRPSKLLFTRIDETTSFGPVVNLAVEASLPLSFFTSGQLIPDDLEEATLGRLRDLVFGGDATIEIAPRRLGAAA